MAKLLNTLLIYDKSFQTKKRERENRMQNTQEFNRNPCPLMRQNKSKLLTHRNYTFLVSDVQQFPSFFH